MVGSGHVLAVSTWRWDGTAVTERRLKLVTLSGLRQIASGPGAIVAASADGGHIAAFRSTAAWPEGPANYEYPPPPTTAPSVGIYSAKGALLSEIALGNNPDAMLKVALRGNQLVVLTVATPPSGPRTATLEVYNWKAGELVHTWPLASDISPDLLGVSGRIAVLQGSRGLKGSPSRGSLHLVDLASGKDVAFAANGWRGSASPVGAPRRSGRVGLRLHHQHTAREAAPLREARLRTNGQAARGAEQVDANGGDPSAARQQPGRPRPRQLAPPRVQGGTWAGGRLIRCRARLGQCSGMTPERR